MNSALSTSQLAYLANELTQIGATLAQYENDHANDPDVDLPALQQLIANIDEAADGLANAAAATIFNDSAAAYAHLTDITQRANETAASLSKEAAQFSRIAKIASAMLGLATALGSGNPLNVFKAIATATQAVSGH